MKKILAALGCGVLLSVIGLTQTAPVSKTDQEFIDMVAQTDMLEAHLGQMAQDQASSQKVKDYAQMLVSDHTADYKQIGAVAAKIGATAPNGLGAAENHMIAPFAKLKGAAFDKHFIHEMIAGHTKAIAAYKREDAKTQNADLKAYIAQALPVLEKHLKDAQDLENEKSS